MKLKCQICIRWGSLLNLVKKAKNRIQFPTNITKVVFVPKLDSLLSVLKFAKQTKSRGARDRFRPCFIYNNTTSKDPESKILQIGKGGGEREREGQCLTVMDCGQMYGQVNE
jgi:hypothetical protein